MIQTIQKMKKLPNVKGSSGIYRHYRCTVDLTVWLPINNFELDAISVRLLYELVSIEFKINIFNFVAMNYRMELHPKIFKLRTILDNCRL